MTDLLPCPFCGGQPRIRSDWGGVEISCENRDCPICVSCDDSGTNALEIAIGWWNTRVTPAPEEQALLHAVLNQARETLLVGIRGSNEDLMHSLGKLNLVCKAHWDWQTRTHMNSGGT